MKEHDIVKATVSSIVDFGVFVKVNDQDGLVHISEISDKFVKDINDFFRVGDVIDLEVLSIDPHSNKLKLSYRSVKRASINRHFSIGFSTLQQQLPIWIDYKLKEIKHDG
jgi:general stress protein 13